MYKIDIHAYIQNKWCEKLGRDPIMYDIDELRLSFTSYYAQYIISLTVPLYIVYIVFEQRPSGQLLVVAVVHPIVVFLLNMPSLRKQLAGILQMIR